MKPPKKSVNFCVIANKQKTHAVALSMVKKLGGATYKKLIESFGTAEKVFHLSIKKHTKLGKQVSDQILKEKETLFNKANSLSEKHQQKGIFVIPYEDPRYPERLRQTHNPPPILYSTTSIDFNQRRIVAIVGTRQATPYGKSFVKKLIADLRSYNPIIVSGLAYGIDMCAHKAALDHGIPTIGVLPGGVDIVYPADHEKSIPAINKQGAVVSEYPLGKIPEKYDFPLRNRIIAGLADAVIVIEAGRKSGSLITAQYANTFGRDVFALPGNIESNYSKGCLDLIKTHQAHMITGVKDLAYIMNWLPSENTSKTQENYIPLTNLNNEEQCIIKTLHQKSPLDLQGLTSETTLPMDRMVSLLLQLEVKSFVRALPGNQYELCR